MKSKDIIEIKSINRNDLNQITEVAGLYANVFAGPPWNESTKCLTTGSFYGPDTQAGNPCPDCSTPLAEAYPIDETVEYILGELGKANPIGLLAFVNSELAGFSWGYQTTPEELAESKWKTPKMQNTVKDLLSSYGVSGKLFYGSETGVDPEFRGKGLGKQLVRTRLNQVIRSGEKFMVVRTNLNSPMYGICSEMGEFAQILGPVARTGWFNNKYKPAFEYVNTLDSENPERVLFLYDRVAQEKWQQTLNNIPSRMV